MHQAYEQLKVALSGIRQTVDDAGFLDVKESDFDAIVERMDIKDVRDTLTALKEKRRLVEEAKVALPERPPLFEDDTLKEAQKDPHSFFAAHKVALTSAGKGEAVGRAELKTEVVPALSELDCALSTFDPEGQRKNFEEKGEMKEKGERLAEILRLAQERPFFPYTLQTEHLDIQLMSVEDLTKIRDRLPLLGQFLKEKQIIVSHIDIHNTLPIVELQTPSGSPPFLNIALANDDWQVLLNQELSLSVPDSAHSTQSEQVRLDTHFLLWDSQFEKNLGVYLTVNPKFYTDTQTEEFFKDEGKEAFARKLVRLQTLLEENASEVLRKENPPLEIFLTPAKSSYMERDLLPINILDDEERIQQAIREYVHAFQKQKMFEQVQSELPNGKRIVSYFAQIPDDITSTQLKVCMKEILETLQRENLDRTTVTFSPDSRSYIDESVIELNIKQEDWKERFATLILEYKEKEAQKTEEAREAQTRRYFLEDVQQSIKDFNGETSGKTMSFDQEDFSDPYTPLRNEFWSHLKVLKEVLQRRNYPHIKKIVLLASGNSRKDQNGVTYINMIYTNRSKIENEVDFFANVSFVHNDKARQGNSVWDEGFYFTGDLQENHSREGMGKTYASVDTPTEQGTYKENRLIKGVFFTKLHTIKIDEETTVAYMYDMVRYVRDGPAKISISSQGPFVETYQVNYKDADIVEVLGASENPSSQMLRVGQQYEYLPKTGFIEQLITRRAIVTDLVLNDTNGKLEVILRTDKGETLQVLYTKINQYLKDLPKSKKEKKKRRS